MLRKERVLSRSIKQIILSLLFLLLTACSSTSINRQEKISKYFTMGEAIHSTTAQARGIKNIPNRQEKKNIRYTAKRLDDVRKLLGRPVVVTSWYRSEKLNRAVGGSSSSGHRNGMSVDILLKKGKNGKKEFDKVKMKLKSYDQLIYYPNRGHLHIGFKKYKFQERKQVMTRYN